MLGVNRSYQGENNAVVFITGNGCTVSPDMRRRSLFCELFIEHERAEDRIFQNLLEVPQLLEMRADILTALMALVMNWQTQAKPKPSRSHSSFPEWANIIGGIVEAAGYGCPIQDSEIAAAADSDGKDMRKLVEAITNGSIMRSVKFDELVDVCREHGLFDTLIGDEALDRKQKTSFSRLLRTYDRRLIGGYRFSLEGEGHSRRYAVEKLHADNEKPQ